LCNDGIKYSKINLQRHIKVCSEIQKLTPDLLKRYHDGSNPSVTALQNEFDLHRDDVVKILKSNGLEVWETRIKEKNESLVLKLGNEGKNASEIAGILGDITPGGVKVIMGRLGITSSYSDAIKEKDEEIRKVYYNGNMPTPEEISKITGRDVTTVYDTLKKLDLRNWSEIIYENKLNKCIELQLAGKNYKEISGEVGWHAVTVSKKLKELGYKPNMAHKSHPKKKK
jgi:hypothetical protein